MPATRRLTCRAIAIAGGLALAAPLRLPAADVTPVQPAPSDDSIAAAGRQLDALKVDANSRAAGSRSSLPTLALPQPGVPSDADAVAVPTSPKQPQKPKRDPNNWLVDAMMSPRERSSRDRDRQSDPRDPRRQKLDPKDRGLSNRDDEEDSDLEGQDGEPTKSAENRDRVLSEKEAPKDTFNPLNQYMTNWLAPRDYELLRHTIEPDNTSRPNGPDRVSATSMGAGDPAALAGVAGLDGFSPERAAPAPLSKPADNPYLQFLAPPEPSPVDLAPPPPPAAITPSPVFAPPAPTPTPSTGLPDFVKPNTDEKYFKPLKRF